MTTEYSIESGEVIDGVAVFDEFSHLPLTAIVASLTNPRKTFDALKLAELADSIKASGVHQPVLVRPLPGSRVAETSDALPEWAFPKLKSARPTHELVAGERRYRACKLAGVATIPALIRELTDHQVLEIQIIENLQRDDLSALEEAEGYEQLCRETGISKDDVGTKIGKSRAYVYGRLKLLDLSMECKEAMRAGQIDASRAILIARIPDTKLQTKALAEATRTDYNDEVPSVRTLQRWLQSNVMLRLENAPFRITDARLVESAGSCKDCPKRTGANPDLFADVQGADICTDPACYNGKVDAQRASILATAKKKGMRLIEGAEAKEICNPYSDRLDGYSPLNQVRADLVQDGDQDQLGVLLGKDAPAAVLIENPWSKELIAAVPTEAAEAVLLAKGLIKAVKPKDKATNYARELEQLQNQAKRDTKAAVDAAVLQGIVQAVRATDDTMALALLGSSLLRSWLITQLDDWATNEEMALALGYTFQEGEDENDGLVSYIRACNNADLHRAAASLMAMDDDRNIYADYEPLVINTLSDMLAVPIKALTKEATAKVRTEYVEKIKAVQTKIEAQKSPLLIAPAALAIASAGEVSKGRGGKGPAAPASVAPLRKRKLSAGEAQAAIAAAMQDQETEPGAADASQGDEASPVPVSGFALPVGARVQIQAEYAGLSLTLQKWADKKGVITAKDIPTDGSLFAKFAVTFKGRNGGVATFYAHQFKVLPS